MYTILRDNLSNNFEKLNKESKDIKEGSEEFKNKVLINNRR